MKKRIIFLSLLILLCIAGVLCYRNYMASKTDKYVKMIENRMKGPLKFDIQNGVQVERIIKRTPFKLVILVKWGAGEEAYVSADNWLTRAHDHIEICPFDMKRKLTIYE